MFVYNYGWDRMVVVLTSNCAISAYHHKCYEFESRSWWGVLHTSLCDQVCQWLSTGRWFFSWFLHQKNDCHNMTEILLKVVLNTITLIPFVLLYSTANLSDDIYFFALISWHQGLRTFLQRWLIFFNRTKQRVHLYKSNMMGSTSGAGTVSLPEHLSSPPVFSGVRVTRSLVLCSAL